MASQSRSLNMNSINRGRLKQRFDLIRKLGQGTYGKVQLGINKVTGEEVALKTIKKSKIENDVDLLRIKREINIMSCCNHPNIIHIYEVFENREKIILVMEYAPGGELYDYLNERKKLNEAEAKRLFSQIASAIYYCHKHYIVHRDLKLENILLDVNFNAKIADFGLSNVYGEDPLTTFCGSPLYASPEIVKGIPYHGPEVDCWSLGVLLYTLIYGSMPFDGSNFKKLVKQITTSTYYEPPLRSSASELIKALLNVDVRRRLTIVQIVAHAWLQSTDCATVSEEYCHLAPAKGEFLIGINNRSEDTLDEVSEISLLDGMMDEDKSEAAIPCQLTPGPVAQEENVERLEVNQGNVLQKLTVQIREGAEVQKTNVPAICNGEGGQENNVKPIPLIGVEEPRKSDPGFKLTKTGSQPRDISRVKPKRGKPVKKALTSALPELRSTPGSDQAPASSSALLQLPDITKMSTRLDVPSNVAANVQPANELATDSIVILVSPVTTAPAVPKKPSRKILNKESKSDKSITAGLKDLKVTASANSAFSSELSKNLEVPKCLPKSVADKLVSLEKKSKSPSVEVKKEEEPQITREVSNQPITANPPAMSQPSPPITPISQVKEPGAQAPETKSPKSVQENAQIKTEEATTPSTTLDAKNRSCAEMEPVVMKIETKAPASKSNSELSPGAKAAEVAVDKLQENSCAEIEAKPKVKLRKKKVEGSNNGEPQQPTRIARRNSKVISQKTAELIKNLKETNKSNNSNSKKIIVLPSLNDVKKKFEDKKKEEEIIHQVTRRCSITIKCDGENGDGNPTPVIRRPKIVQVDHISEKPIPNITAEAPPPPKEALIKGTPVEETPKTHEELKYEAEPTEDLSKNIGSEKPEKTKQERKTLASSIEVRNESKKLEARNPKSENVKLEKSTTSSTDTGETDGIKPGLGKTAEPNPSLPESSQKLLNLSRSGISGPNTEIPSPLPLSPSFNSKVTSPQPSSTGEEPAQVQKITENELPAQAPSILNIKKAISNQDVPLVKPSPLKRIAKAISNKQVTAPLPEINSILPQSDKGNGEVNDPSQLLVAEVKPGRPSGLKLFIPPFSPGVTQMARKEGRAHVQSPPPITPKQKAVETIGTLITKIKSNNSRERLIPIERTDGLRDLDGETLGQSSELGCSTPSTSYSRQSSVGDPTYNGPIQKSRREFIIPITFEPAKEAESISPNNSGGVYNSHRQPSVSLPTPDTGETTEDEFFENGTNELLSPDYLFTSLLQRVRGLSQRIHDSEKQQYELSSSSPSTSRRTPSPSPGFNGTLSSRDSEPIMVTISSAGSSPKVKRHISLQEPSHAKSPTTLQRRHSTYLTSPRGQYTPSYLTLPRSKYSTLSEETSTEENSQTDSCALPSESVLLQKAVHKGRKSTTSQPSTISKFFNTHLGKLYSKRTQSDSVLSPGEQTLTESSPPTDPASSPSSVSDRILRKSYYNRYNYNHLPNYKSTKELSANITKKLEQLLNEI